MSKLSLKSIAIYIAGLALLTLGQRLFVEIGFGAGSFDTFCVGVSQFIPVTAGTIVAVSSVLMIFLSALMQKKLPSIKTIITLCVFSVFFDFWGIILSFVSIESFAFAIKACMYIFALAIATFGTAVYFKAEIAKSAYDEMIMANMKVFKVSVGIGKSILEIFMFVLAVFVRGPVGVTTFVTAILFGPFLRYWIDFLNEEKFSFLIIKEGKS